MAAYVGFLRFPFVGFLALLFAGSIAAQPESTRIYNTVKEKLANGLQVVGGTVTSSGWGNDYRQTANENIMVVAMIESPSGVDIADEIAAVSGVDIVMAASTDLGSFSGLRQGDPAYERMVDEIVRATNEAGLYLGGPQAWMDREREKLSGESEISIDGVHLLSRAFSRPRSAHSDRHHHCDLRTRVAGA